MIKLNGRLNIKVCEPLSTSSWNIVADFIDNAGMYNALHINIGDVIYSKAENEETIEFHLFVVRSIKAETNSDELYAIIEFAENITEDNPVSNPLLEDIAIICRTTSDVGFGLISSDVQELSIDDIVQIRNADLLAHDYKFTEYVKTLVTEAANGIDFTNLIVPGNFTAKTNILLDTPNTNVLLNKNTYNVVYKQNSIKYKKDFNSTESLIATDNYISSDDTNRVINVIGNDTAELQTHVNGYNLAVRNEYVNASEIANYKLINTANNANITFNASGTQNGNIDLIVSGEQSNVNIESKQIILNTEFIDATAANGKFLKLEVTDTNYDDYTENDVVTVGYLNTKYTGPSGPTSGDITELETRVGILETNDTNKQSAIATNAQQIAEIKQQIQSINNVDNQLQSDVTALKNAVKAIDTTAIQQQVNLNTSDIINIKTKLDTVSVVSTIPGTYSQVTVNAFGQVTSGIVHDAVDIIGTSNTEFGLSNYDDSNTYATLFAWTNNALAPKENKIDENGNSTIVTTPIPFIRYNFVTKTWEISNDGQRYYELQLGKYIGTVDPIISKNLDCGYVIHEADTTIDLSTRNMTSGGITQKLKNNIDLNTGDSI